MLRRNGPQGRCSPGSPTLCIHFITYGITRGDPYIPMPVIMHFDLCSLQAPPRHLLDRYTGASRVLSESFFSLPRNERFYQDSLDRLEDELQRLLDPPSRQDVFAAVLVNCRAGMHRSVAMAERLASDVQSWRWDGLEGVHLLVEHLDTDVRRGLRRAQRARAVVHEQHCRKYEEGEP